MEATRLAYADFTPGQIKSGRKAVYERFDALVTKANDWLRHNNKMKVVKCETIEVKDRFNSQGQIDTDRSTHLVTNNHCPNYIKCLRLWIVPKGSADNPEPQQLGYLNVVPACGKPSGVLTDPEFDSFSDTINGLNQMLKQKPLPGSILNVETVSMRFTDFRQVVDPDCCSYPQIFPADIATYFLLAVRLFYVGGSPANEELGSVDFVPATVKQEGTFSTGEFGPVHNVMSSAQQWIKGNPGLNIVGIQTVNYQKKRTTDGQLDTQTSLRCEHAKLGSHLIHIVRVMYTTRHAEQPSSQPVPIELTYRTFLPSPVTSASTFHKVKYEPLSENYKRVAAWLQYTNAKMVTIETLPMVNNDRHAPPNPDESLFSTCGQEFDQVMFVFRVYLDGDYKDPPLEALPPVPAVQKSDRSCSLM